MSSRSPCTLGGDAGEREGKGARSLRRWREGQPIELRRCEKPAAVGLLRTRIEARADRYSAEHEAQALRSIGVPQSATQACEADRGVLAAGEIDHRYIRCVRHGIDLDPEGRFA